MVLFLSGSRRAPNDVQKPGPILATLVATHRHTLMFNREAGVLRYSPPRDERFSRDPAVLYQQPRVQHAHQQHNKEDIECAAQRVRPTSRAQAQTLQVDATDCSRCGTGVQRGCPPDCGPAPCHAGTTQPRREHTVPEVPTETHEDVPRKRVTDGHACTTEDRVRQVLEGAHSLLGRDQLAKRREEKRARDAEPVVSHMEWLKITGNRAPTSLARLHTILDLTIDSTRRLVRLAWFQQ